MFTLLANSLLICDIFIKCPIDLLLEDKKATKLHTLPPVHVQSDMCGGQSQTDYERRGVTGY